MTIQPWHKLALKFAFIILLFWFMSHKGLLSVDATRAALSRWPYIVPAFFSLILANFIGTYRWHLLMKAQQIIIPLKRTIQLAFVGYFFNIALPGAVSGDLVKALYVAKESPGKRAHAFSSILFDRLAGVTGLILISLSAWGTTLLQELQVTEHRLWPAIEMIVGISGAGAILFFSHLFFVSDNRDSVLRLLKFFQTKSEKMGSLTRIYEGLRNYGRQKRVAIGSILLSLLMHSFVIFSFVCFAKAIGDHDLSVISIFIVVPLGLLITAIPILPAGMGTGHAAFFALFDILGSNRGVDLFNIYVLFQILMGVAGGIVYLFFRSRLPQE